MNSEHREKFLTQEMSYAKIDKESGPGFGESMTGDENIGLLGGFDMPTREKILIEMSRRKELIVKLLLETGSNPDLCFNRIFGKSSIGMQMEARPYGIYFYGGDDSVFQRVYASFQSFRHGGATVNKASYLQEKDFLNLVGFGSESSKSHEFVHMFNSMLPIGDMTRRYEAIHEDVRLPTDNDGIRKIKSEQYMLWANSVLKDEILARIDNKQILLVEEQEIDDQYSGAGKVFTTYMPGRLYGHISNYSADTKKFGVDPVDKSIADEFWKRYNTITEPIRLFWLDAYNKNIRSIQRALQSGTSALTIKSIIIGEDFQDIADRMESIDN